MVQRGHDRRPCFRTLEDRRFYLKHLGRAMVKFGCQVHAYVLMTNHVHLLVTPSASTALSEALRAVNLRLTQRINAREGRTGTLWESRFKASTIEADEYLLACHRYIELNPVRAAMVAHPAEYPWSSYAANAGLRADPLVSPHPLYQALGSSGHARQRAYRTLFLGISSRTDERDIRTATASEHPLGHAGFRTRLGVLTGRDLSPRRHGGRRAGAGRPRRR